VRFLNYPLYNLGFGSDKRRLLVSGQHPAPAYKYVLIQNRIFDDDVLFDFAVLQNNAIFHVSAFANFDAAEQDAVLDLPFDDAAVRDQGVAGVGVVRISRRRFVLNLRINEIFLEKQLPHTFGLSSCMLCL